MFSVALAFTTYIATHILKTNDINIFMQTLHILELGHCTSLDKNIKSLHRMETQKEKKI